MISIQTSEVEKLKSWLSNQEKLKLTGIPNDEVVFKLKKTYSKHANILRQYIIPELTNVISEYLDDEINVRMIIYECDMNSLDYDDDVDDKYFDIKYEIFNTKINYKPYDVFMHHSFQYNKSCKTLDFKLVNIETKDRIFRRIIDNKEESEYHDDHFNILDCNKHNMSYISSDDNIYCNCDESDDNILTLCNYFMILYYGKRHYINLQNTALVLNTTKITEHTNSQYKLLTFKELGIFEIIDKIRMKNIIVIEKVILTKLVKLLRMQFSQNNFAKKLP